MTEHYARAMASLAPPAESCFVDTSYGRTHVLSYGDAGAKPLVLWHGQNASAVTWIRWFPLLAPAYRVHAVDVIGGMGKSAPSRPSKRGSAYGLWAAEVLKRLGLASSSMMGISQGSWLIVKLASEAPEMISSAVLMSPAGIVPIGVVRVLHTIPRILFRSPHDAAQAMYDMVSAPDSPHDTLFLDLFELMLRYFRSESTVPVLTDEELRSLRSPSCLLLAQFETSMDPYKALKRGLALLPYPVSAEIVPGVGHSMMHKEPDWVAARVASFLRTHAA